MIDLYRLDVFRVGCEFVDSIRGLAGKNAELRDQLDRASSSVVLNVAEGAGRTTTPDKRRFYLIARGSAYECAAIIDPQQMARRRALGGGAARDLVEALLVALRGAPGAPRSPPPSPRAAVSLRKRPAPQAECRVRAALARAPTNSASVPVPVPVPVPAPVSKSAERALVTPLPGLRRTANRAVRIARA